MPISFSGLASGLDTGSLIDQLVAVESARADPLVKRQQDLSTKKSIISSLSSALGSLGALSKGMDLASEVQPRKATVSDARISVAASSTAAAGNYDLRIKQLAQAQSTVSRGLTASGVGVLGDGGVAITVGSTTKNVTWTSADSLDSIASKINAANAGVSASVLFDGTSHRIVTMASGTGLAARPTFADSGDGLDLANSANVKVTAQNAIVNINGLDVSRSTNVMSDVVSGLTLTLNSVPTTTDPNTKIMVAQDTDAIATKVKDLVGAFNAVNSALHIQLDYTGTTKGSNTLFGDSTLRQLQQQINTLASSAYGTSNISQLGITRDKSGNMTLDASKLSSAIAADPDAVAKLFVNGGFATAISSMTDSYTRATDGLLAVKSQAFSDRSKLLQTQIDRIYRSADATKTRLEAQFSALESAMSALRSQSSQLSAVLG
jgi:flagellar hook-associated protein 2